MRLFQLTGASRQRWWGWHPQWAGPRHSARSPWSPGRPGAHRQLRCWRLWPWHCRQNTPTQKESDTHFSLQGLWSKTVSPVGCYCCVPRLASQNLFSAEHKLCLIRELWKTEESMIFFQGGDMASHSNVRKWRGTAWVAHRNELERHLRGRQEFTNWGANGGLYPPIHVSVHPKQVPSTSPPAFFLPSSNYSPRQSFIEHLMCARNLHCLEGWWRSGDGGGWARVFQVKAKEWGTGQTGFMHFLLHHKSLDLSGSCPLGHWVEK